jgi:hypothetical protein
VIYSAFGEPKRAGQDPRARIKKCVNPVPICPSPHAGSGLPGGRRPGNDAVTIDDDGKIHLTGVKAVEEPPSLVDLRKRASAMVPRVDLPEVVLEVMSWEDELAAAFTAVSGGKTRLEDLDISIAACLAGHSMNVGYRPIAKKGARPGARPALARVPELLPARDDRPGQRPAGSPPGRPAAGAGVGRPGSTHSAIKVWGGARRWCRARCATPCTWSM